MSIVEKIKIMQAYVDGKHIQVRDKYESSSEDDWKDINFTPNWDWGICDYRIKPEEEKPLIMTNRQLAKWCADNNGQVRNRHSYIRTYHSYCQGEDDVSVREETRIRPWGFDEWIEPTVEIYNRDCKE